MNLGSLLQSWESKIPGHNWLSDSFLGDVITGGLARGAKRNDWRAPFGHNTSSFDDIFGAGASRTEGGRNLARGVGAAFGGGALYGALGGGSAAAGEGAGGASEVGYGFPLAEEAGGAGAGGQLSGPAASMGWQDYLRQYGRQGQNLLSAFGQGAQGQQFSPPYMPPIDNSMILPPPQEPSYSDLPPGLMTMLLAQAFQKQQEPQQPEGPAIRSGGIA